MPAGAAMTTETPLRFATYLAPNMLPVYAAIVVIGMIGLLLDVAFEKLRGKLVSWADPAFPIMAGST